MRIMRIRRLRLHSGRLGTLAPISRGYKASRKLTTQAIYFHSRNRSRFLPHKCLPTVHRIKVTVVHDAGINFNFRRAMPASLQQSLFLLSSLPSFSVVCLLTFLPPRFISFHRTRAICMHNELYPDVNYIEFELQHIVPLI
jgi:hypothetical protein